MSLSNGMVSTGLATSQLSVIFACWCWCLDFEQVIGTTICANWDICGGYFIEVRLVLCVIYNHIASLSFVKSVVRSAKATYICFLSGDGWLGLAFLCRDKSP